MNKLVLFLLLIVVGCGSGGSDTPTKPQNPDPEPIGRYLSLSFDDGVSLASIGEHLWLFKRYDAKVTYYISHAPSIIRDLGKLDALRSIVDDGHEVGYHTTWHQNANTYIAENSLVKWFDSEIVVGMSALDGVGIHPVTFAYPFGAYSEETDNMLKGTFEHVRYFKTAYESIEPQAGYEILAYSIDAPYLDLNKIYDALDKLRPGQTLYLATHIIGDWENGWHVSVQNLEMILSYAHSQGVKFCTVRDCP